MPQKLEGVYLLHIFDEAGNIGEVHTIIVIP